jgi:hypothetical protein
MRVACQVFLPNSTPSSNPVQCRPVILIADFDTAVKLQHWWTPPYKLLLDLELQVRAIPLETVSLLGPVDGKANIGTSQGQTKQHKLDEEPRPASTAATLFSRHGRSRLSP